MADLFFFLIFMVGVCAIISALVILSDYWGAYSLGYSDACDKERTHDYFDGWRRRAYEKGHAKKLEEVAKADALYQKAKARSARQNRI